VLGFTYNMTNHATQYQNGVDMHFDWGASQFPTAFAAVVGARAKFFRLGKGCCSQDYSAAPLQ
jgi:hypothetical protein